MKTQKFIMIVGILVLFIACSSDDESPTPPDGPIVSSLFENDAEGWKIVGDAQGGYVEPSYSPDGGLTGGYIYAEDDVTGGWWYFMAPESYSGDKTNYYGAFLKYSQFQVSDMSDQRQEADIVFRNGDKIITYVHRPEDYPGSNWTPYAIPISTGNGWFKGHYDSGVVATETDMKEVLSNVTEFVIRGEFEHGPDKGGLDNVVISR